MEAAGLRSQNGHPQDSQSPPGVLDTGIQLTNTVVAIVKEVGEALQSVPYVQSLSGVILQIIKVREEIQTNKKRCCELIDKVLCMSKSVYEKLAEIAKSSQREKLGRLENHLREHERILTGVYITLEQHRTRSRFTQLLNRGLEDLNQQDRRLDELNTNLILDIIFHITMEQSNSSSASSPSLPTEPANTAPVHVLPPKPPLIVEREDPFYAALYILITKECSRVAILGGGGMGKTTLARAILHDPHIIGRYSLRYFLSCESAPDIDKFLLAMGNMVGIKTSTLPSVLHALHGPTVLLCLDNFETLWEPFETRTKVEELLESIASVPGLSLIITLRGEQRPSKIAWSTPLIPPLSALSLKGSKAILQHIAGAKNVSKYTLELLEMIDGIPLAITLISTLLRDGESMDSLWRRWFDNSTEIIHTGGNDRQSNLNRSISLSVYSLRMNAGADGSRLLLAAFSLLPEGFSADTTALDSLHKSLSAKNNSTIQRVRSLVKRSSTPREPADASDKQNRISDIHAAVQTLRTVSLVRIDDTGPARRIRMLSPIRLFCHQFLTSQIALVQNKLVDYYVRLLSEAQDDVANSEFYAQIVPEIQNMHSIFQRAFISDTSKELDITDLVDATIYLTEWSWYTGYHSRDTLQLALSKTTQTPTLQARCLLSIGDLYQGDAEAGDAEKCFREAARLFKRGRDAIGEANALQCLGNVLYTTRQLDEAEVVLKASLVIYTKVDDKQGQASGRFRLGELYADKKRYSEAEENLTTALEDYQSLEDLLGQANASQNLSRLHIALGNMIQAEEFARQSLAAAKKAQYALGEGNALRLLGQIYRLSNKIAEARQVLEDALIVQKQQNNLVGQLNAANDLGQVYIQLDQLGMAEKLLNDCVEVEQDIIQKPDILTKLGWLYLCANEVAKAEEVLDTALEWFQKYDDKYWQAEVLSHLGNVYFLSNRLDDAERVLTSIPDEDLSEDIQMYRLWVLGDLFRARGHFDHAESTLSSAMDAAEWCQSLYQQGNIQRSLGSLEQERGHIDLAIEKFTESLELHRRAQWVSEQATDLKRISEAYTLVGRSKEAATAFKESEVLMGFVREGRELPSGKEKRE